MGLRGPRSAEAKGLVVVAEFGKRPDPPDYLTERQAEIWRETAASEPTDFFNTAALRGLLADYCRHRQAAEDVSAIIDSFKPEWLKNGEGVKRYQALLKIRESETRAAKDMARALRLTNQSRYTPMAAATAARNAAKGPKPWEV
jgi:phage terminase small subunit